MSALETIGIKLLESKLKEIKPQEVLGVFGGVVKQEIDLLKSSDTDHNGVDDFTDCLHDVEAIEQAGERIIKRLEAARAAKATS